MNGTEHNHRPATRLILCLAMLFLAVMLAVAGIGRLAEGVSTFSAIVSLCGTALFGIVGILLLVAIIRDWKEKK